MKLDFVTTLILSILLIVPFQNTKAQEYKNSRNSNNIAVPFSTDSSHITLWNGNGYSPVFIKGINFGVAVPGTFPGELAASRKQYGRWLAKISEIGYNTVRVYTLHYPRFYEVLDSFNRLHPHHSVYLFQGIWLEEELEGYHNDLHFLSDTMDLQIDEAIDCMHGNRVIPYRRGKAYGTYKTDISKWLLTYIIGREVQPQEVLTTNFNHPTDTTFAGKALSMVSGSPTEIWVTRRLNRAIVYERKNYRTERPVSFSSWPTLDPLHHSSEVGDTQEDTASIDLENMDISKAPAGFFISYHAYPYYPNFISEDSVYQVFEDYMGPNSYLGYLTALKKHYSRFPLIIAETGTPSSWGNAHYSSSGMNHGGMDERQEGINFIRIMQTLKDAGCGGGMEFELIDEWFKRTWITDLMDFNPYSRILWHNITAAEQNFGLIKFVPDTLIMHNLADFGSKKPVTVFSAGTDFDFLHLHLDLKNSLSNTDTLWIAIDTYADTLGESVLPTDDTIQNRAEFVLRLTNFSAELYVTRAYDLYGNWFGISSPDQLFHSTATDGAPWDIVRWKNNTENPKIQYIGNLKIRQAKIFPSSLDAVVISDSTIDVRLPWTLINFSDPSGMRVIHDFKDIPGTQDTVSDGIAFTLIYRNIKEVVPGRFTWNTWKRVENIVEKDKACVGIIRQNLYLFNSIPIPRPDEYSTIINKTMDVDSAEGLLHNDVDFDGDTMSVFLNNYPTHGSLYLNADGSFTYIPDYNFQGTDRFSYFTYDGMEVSDTASVTINVVLTAIDQDKSIGLQIYPNPARQSFNIILSTAREDVSYQISDLAGRMMRNSTFHVPQDVIDISAFPPGVYILQFHLNNRPYRWKLVKL